AYRVDVRLLADGPRADALPPRRHLYDVLVKLFKVGRRALEVCVEAGPHVLGEQEGPLLRQPGEIAEHLDRLLHRLFRPGQAELRAPGDDAHLARLFDEAEVLVAPAEEA